MPILIKVNKSQNSAKIIFDNCGHIYLEYNDKTYELIIDQNNNILLEEINAKNHLYDINDDLSFKKGKIKLTNSLNSLKGKVYKEYLKELDKMKEEDYDINEDETEDDFNRIQKYFPEDFDYFESYQDEKNLDNKDEINNYELEEINNYFVFLANNINEHFPEIKMGEDSNALYETLIYNKDLTSGDLIFKTKLINSQPIYRLRIYNSGEFAFRAIGNYENYYLLSDINNKLNLFLLNNKNKNKLTINTTKSDLIIENINL